MAIQIDYFLAPNDEDAAASATLEAGPRSESTDVVPSSDIDPGLALGYLHELLTGASVEEYLSETAPALIAVSPDEQKVVLELDPSLTRRLAELPHTVDDLAARWAAFPARDEAEDWNPRPRDLVDFLTGIRALAQRSIAGEGSVYCWLWP